MSTGHNYVNAHGYVRDYAAPQRMAGIELSADLQQGQRVHFLGTTTDFEQTIRQIRLESRVVSSAPAGSKVTVRVDQPVVPDDAMHKEL